MNILLNSLKNAFSSNQGAEDFPDQAVIIDVRSTAEFQSGFVTGAVNITLDKLATEVPRLVRKRDAPIVLYCASGMRSDAAIKTLKSLGYSRLFNGISASTVSIKLNLPIIR